MKPQQSEDNTPSSSRRHENGQETEEFEKMLPFTANFIRRHMNIVENAEVVIEKVAEALVEAKQQTAREIVEKLDDKVIELFQDFIIQHKKFVPADDIRGMERGLSEVMLIITKIKKNYGIE